MGFLFIYNLNIWELFSSGLAIIFAFGVFMQFIFEKLPFIKRSIDDNQALSGFLGTLSIVWALLLGFITLTITNDLQSSENIVQNEAQLVTHLYDDTQLLKIPSQKLVINNLLEQYANNVIKLEWPAMSVLKDDKTNENIIIQLKKAISSYYINDNGGQQTLLYNLLTQVTDLSAIRMKRIDTAMNGMITKTEWWSITITTVMAILSNCLLAIRKEVHLLMHLIFAFAASMLITLIIVTDAPLVGTTQDIFPTQLSHELAIIKAH